MCYLPSLARLAGVIESPQVIPTLRYKDAPAAIRWLVDVVGFRESMVVPGPDGTIAHAQLAWGNGMIMLASTSDGSDGRLVLPSGPQTVYVVLDDVKGLYDRVVSAGAKVVQDLRDEDYGGSGCAFEDPEGNVWSFGSYRPEL
jgi:uncharacterized glyoxalase superfamily protein PhnB